MEYTTCVKISIVLKPNFLHVSHHEETLSTVRSNKALHHVVLCCTHCYATRNIIFIGLSPALIHSHN